MKIILPLTLSIDTILCTIDKKSIERIDKLISEYKHTGKYQHQRYKRHYENMFEISKKVHTITLSLISHICKKSNSHISSAKKSCVHSFLVSAFLLYSQLVSSRLLMLRMVGSSERYSTRYLLLGTGKLTPLERSKIAKNSETSSQPNTSRPLLDSHVQQ